MGLSAYHLGLQRDEAVVQLITRLRYLTAGQVSRCLFQNRRRVTARRLLRLVDRGRLKAERLERTHGPLVYYPPSRTMTRAAREALSIAELYCRMLELRPAGAAIERFDVEVALQKIRADAIAVGTLPGRDWAALIEWDTGTTVLERVAAKAVAYDAYAQSGAYRQTAWWRQGIEVSVIFAVPEARVQPLTRLIQRLGTVLRPRIVDHGRLCKDPWALVPG